VASLFDLNKKIASPFYPKMGSMYSSENSIRVGTDEAVIQLTISEVSHDPE
jgi:hypothetical protein